MYVFYPLLGLALMGGLFWLLTQITARQTRLNAELTRLERLAAEVSMNAEAILDQVEERMDRLNAVMAAAEEKVLGTSLAEESNAAALAPIPAPEKDQPSRKRGRPRKPAQSAPESREVQSTAPLESAETPPKTAAQQRYKDAQRAVAALADQGKDAAAIAHELGIPRGEVQLMLNLRGKKIG